MVRTTLSALCIVFLLSMQRNVAADECQDTYRTEIKTASDKRKVCLKQRLPPKKAVPDNKAVTKKRNAVITNKPEVADEKKEEKEAAAEETEEQSGYSPCQVRFKYATDTLYEVGEYEWDDLSPQPSETKGLGWPYKFELEPFTACRLTVCAESNAECETNNKNSIEVRNKYSKKKSFKAKVPKWLKKFRSFSFIWEEVDRPCAVTFQYSKASYDAGAYTWDDINKNKDKGLGPPKSFRVVPGQSCVLTVCESEDARCRLLSGYNSIELTNPSDARSMDVKPTVRKVLGDPLWYKILSFRLEPREESAAYMVPNYVDDISFNKGKYEIGFTLDTLVGVIMGMVLSFVVGLTMYNCSICRASSQSKMVKMLDNDF